jgi:ectoine hydroxylase-related dioxygenase (phytanoyl-CoA dioxygenase family)
MDTDGFEVVRGVLSEDETADLCERALDEMIRRPHMAHSDVMWELRTHPSVLQLFRRLWATNDIVTGFDGIGVSHGDLVLPWHVDQERPSTTRIGIQGIMALSHHNPQTGGLQIIPRSHRLHHRVVLPTIPDATKWEFQPVDVSSFDDKCGDVVQPVLRPGDMVVWDSRTVHRVVRGTACDDRRVTAYLSFEPRSHVPPNVADRRLAGLREGISTTHWASRFVDRGDDRSPPNSITEAMRHIV